MILRFMEGPRSGKAVKISSDDYTMGRDDSCDLLLDNDGVSRIHCRIKKEGDSYILEDNKSTNGVYLNGKKLEEPKTLKDNDTIRVSDYLMLFSSDENLLDSAVMEKFDKIRQEKVASVEETETPVAEETAEDAGETTPPEAPPEPDKEKKEAENPSPSAHETKDEVILDFSKKKDTKESPVALEGETGVKAFLSGSTGIMLLVVIILTLILVYLILTGGN